jgi:transcriptional regulator with XRE-family HTH domain
MADSELEPARAIGEKLRTARQEQKMSLRELAEKADTSASMLSQIENGKAFPSVRSIYSIASALNLPVDYFFPDGNSLEHANQSIPGNTGDMTASELREAKVNQIIDDSALNYQIDTNEENGPVIRATKRPTIELNGGVTWSRLTAQAETGAEYLEITYAPGSTSGANMSHHAGREFGLILEGELTVELGFERYNLCQGDSIIFDSETPHRLTNNCTKPVRALWVVLNERR